MTTEALVSPPGAPDLPGPAFGRLGALPKVDLLPPEVQQAKALRQFQAGAACAVVAAAAIIGALWWQQHGHVASAHRDLAAAQGQQTELQQSADGLATVSSTYAQIAAAKATIATALGGEVRWSGYLNSLSETVPAGVWMTSMAVTASTANGTAAPAAAAGAATAGPAPLATITFQGDAIDRDHVATWLEVLAAQKGYAAPVFTSSAEKTAGGKTLVEFTSSVQVTPGALSHRYDGTGN